MAKYDWKRLEKEYTLGDYKSVSEFLKEKNIPNNGSTRVKTKGWKDKKQDKQDKINIKTVQKVVEKQAEKEANEIVNIKSLANDLALNIIKANSQLEKYIIKSKKKTKTVKYNTKVNKPSEEVTIENEEIEIIDGIIDRLGLKQLTSALKDLNDILTDKEPEQNNDGKINELIGALNEYKKNR